MKTVAQLKHFVEAEIHFFILWKLRYTFSGFFDEQKVQNSSIYLIQNWMLPCWIKVLICFKLYILLLKSTQMFESESLIIIFAKFLMILINNRCNVVASLAFIYIPLLRQSSTGGNWLDGGNQDAPGDSLAICLALLPPSTPLPPNSPSPFHISGRCDGVTPNGRQQWCM